jgi:hypothetical protein
MKIEIISKAPEFTDHPRMLTEDERQRVRSASRLEAIKLHRQLTNSTLRAAIEAVDALRDIEG